MKSLKLAGIIAAGIFSIIMMSVFAIQSSKNKAIGLEQAVETAASDIQVQEKRRVDLVYNLADCVKQYDKHESETLQAIVNGRGSERSIENVTTVISAVAEAYPELQSNENYRQLMTELAATENLIAQHRSNYNMQVGTYNRYVRSFPASIFLGWTGYEIMNYERLYYDAPSDAPQNIFGE